MPKDFAAMEAQAGKGRASQAAGSALRDRLVSRRPTSLRVTEIAPNPLNPRDPNDPEVQELAQSYSRLGQLQAAVVVPREQFLKAYPDQAEALEPGTEWVSIIGNRRLLAARLVGREYLDVRLHDDVRTADDIEDSILIENIQRKALTPLREAALLKARVGRPGQTTRSVAEAIGKTHGYVSQRISLLSLIPELQDAVTRGALLIKTARTVAGLSKEEQQEIADAGPPYGLPASRRKPRVPSGPSAPGPNVGYPVTNSTAPEPEQGPDRADHARSATPKTGPEGPERHPKQPASDPTPASPHEREAAGSETKEAGRSSTVGEQAAASRAGDSDRTAGPQPAPPEQETTGPAATLLSLLHQAHDLASDGETHPEVRTHIEKAIALVTG